MNSVQFRLFLFLALFLVGACSSENQEGHHDKSLVNLSFEDLADVPQLNLNDLTLREAGTYDLPVDSLTSNPIIYPVYFDNGIDEYLLFFNSFVNSLDIYNYEAKKLISRINYPTEGPLALDRKSFPFVKSMDSIYIWTRNPPMFIVTDMDGNQQAVFNYPGEVSVVNVNMVQHFYIVEKRAILAYQPQYYDVKLRDSSNYLVFDLAKGEITKGAARRPRCVTEFPLNGSDAIPRLCLGANASIINFFGAGPLIMKSDASDPNKFETFILRSDHLPKRYKEPENDGLSSTDPNEFMKGTYFSMTYDRYRSLYYMMCLLAEEPVDLNGGRKSVDDKQLSIIIADTLFRKRGEVLLKRNKFFRVMFATRAGLLISNANPGSTAFNEDTLAFTVFEVVDRKDKSGNLMEGETTAGN